MKVGVFFPGFDPTSGGGYTFEQEILEALLEAAPERHHEFYLYFAVNKGQTRKNLPAGTKVNMQWVEPAEPVPPARMFLSEIAAKLGWNNWVIVPEFPLQKAVERDHVQLLWFVTCIYWPVEIPYIATMWDIQHRLQPWFPEVSYKGVWGWDYRESYFTDFLRRATYIITPNQTGQDELSFFYQIPRERFYQLAHPTPRIKQFPSQDETASVLKKYNLSNQYLFYPAQFWSHKNHVNLLRALRILRETYGIDIDLVLTGSNQGNLPYVQSVVENLGLKEYVHILNFIPREDLIALYVGAFALAYVTYFGPENLPPLEAFACGCPVIASDLAGAAEQLGDAALRVNASYPEEIALAVKKIHDDSQLRTDLIAKGLARARHFTSSHYVRGVFEMINNFESIRINWI